MSHDETASCHRLQSNNFMTAGIIFKITDITQICIEMTILKQVKLKVIFMLSVTCYSYCNCLVIAQI